MLPFFVLIYYIVNEVNFYLVIKLMLFVKGCLEYHRPIIINAHPPKGSHKSLHPKAISLEFLKRGNLTKIALSLRGKTATYTIFLQI